MDTKVTLKAVLGRDTERINRFCAAYYILYAIAQAS